jgi:hypothetical protein
LSCTAVRIDVSARTHGILTLAGAVAGAAEVAATTVMQQSDGFSRLWPSLLTTVGYADADLPAELAGLPGE